MAIRADRNILARPLASRARHVELHAPAGLRDLPGSIAFGALAWRFDVTLSVTIRARILPRNVELHHAAADRCPERHIDLILQIAASFGSRLRRRSASPPKIPEKMSRNPPPPPVRRLRPALS